MMVAQPGALWLDCSLRTGRSSPNSGWFECVSKVIVTLAGTMQLEKGNATVPVALFGVSPDSWCGGFHSSFGASARVLQTRRRDADGSGRDDRAPHESTAWFRLSGLSSGSGPRS